MGPHPKIAAEGIPDRANDPLTVTEPTDALYAAWTDVEAALDEELAVRIMFCRCEGRTSGWKISAGEDLSGYADPEFYSEAPPVEAMRSLASWLVNRGRKA